MTFLSKSEKQLPARKWLVGLLLFFFATEVNYFLLERFETDIFDHLLPKIAIFERIELQRMIMMPLL